MKRLKIIEQIIIVLIIAILIPFITIGIIISNISQQSVRNELANNAGLSAQFIGDSVENYVELSKNQLIQIASGLNYIPGTMEKLKYFANIEAKAKLFKNIDIVEADETEIKDYITDGGKITLFAPIDEAQKLYIKAQIDIKNLEVLLENKNMQERKIYIFDRDNFELIASNTADDGMQKEISELVMPDNQQSGFFGKKNTPKAYYKINNPNWVVIVDTTKEITAQTITKARYRIILSLCLAGLSIVFIVGLYTSYLYINIRQLFKGITAISKGNYDKKIHLIKRAFTPHEIVFLAKEFNYMANKINVSYKDLRKKNKELEKLNQYRENLVNATSHEFRTPLTSIIGYTSRLLRHDIELDDETKVKSLQTIKQQAQRLSKMVEDLLVIPELDSLSLKFNIEEVDLINSITKAIEYLEDEEYMINTSISPDLKFVWADEYRLEQIFVNLIDNAKKYTTDKIINISAENSENMPVVKIKNKCDKIPPEIKEKLFEKFIRADSNLTRTTRGTGLGLYIVKGLAEAMKIKIELSADDEFEITLNFEDYVQ